MNSPYKLYYQQIICRDMILKYDYTTLMELPSFTKIVINTTSKLYVTDKKYIISALTALEMVTGQKVAMNQAKKSIATFKLRKGQPIGCQVTLRNSPLYTFLYKLMSTIFPQTRDFHGISAQSINASGNCSIALKNVMLFPELENHYEFFETIRAFTITFDVFAKNKEQASSLYSAMQISILYNNKMMK